MIDDDSVLDDPQHRQKQVKQLLESESPGSDPDGEQGIDLTHATVHDYDPRQSRTESAIDHEYQRSKEKEREQDEEEKAMKRGKERPTKGGEKVDGKRKKKQKSPRPMESDIIFLKESVRVPKKRQKSPLSHAIKSRQKSESSPVSSKVTVFLPLTIIDGKSIGQFVEFEVNEKAVAKKSYSSCFISIFSKS